MKNLLVSLTIVLAVNMNSGLLAQESSKANEMGDLMCNCINKLMDDLHPQLKVFVEETDKMGMQKAQENLVKYISENPDEAESLQKSAQSMSDFENYILKFEGCEDMTNKIDKAGANEEDFESKLVEYLRNNDTCNYAYIFYKMGTGKK